MKNAEKYSKFYFYVVCNSKTLLKVDVKEPRLQLLCFNLTQFLNFNSKAVPYAQVHFPFLYFILFLLF